MGQYNYQKTWTFTAQNDLSDETAGTGAINKPVSGQTGDIAADGLTAKGILVAGVNSGDTGTYAYEGVINYTAGIAISSEGLPLTPVASGYMTVASDGDFAVGKSGAAVTSGSVSAGIFNFPTAWYVASGGVIY